MRAWLVVAVAVALAAIAVAAAGCGGKSSNGPSTHDDPMVWCAAPGERVDKKFKREYPELHMPKSVCDKFR